MKTEAAHNFVRIVANYFRLGLNLSLGLIFVPFALQWLGTAGFGVITALGAGTGLAGMFREIATRAAVRELGAALHANDDRRFRTVYNSALVVATIAAGCAAVIFTGVALAVPLLLRGTPQLVPAARVLVGTQGFYLVCSILFSPTFNMLVVRERFVSYNFWTLAERSSMLVSAVLLKYVFGVSTPAAGVAWWGVSCCAMNLVTFAIPVVQLIRRDPRLSPRPSEARADIVRQVFSTMKWYILVEVASSLHERIGQLIMTFFFTVDVGSVVFGVALQFVSYVRQATQGVTFGLDAVSARMAAKGDAPLKTLTYHSTRAHGLVAIPVGLAVFLFAEPLIRVWIGNKFQNDPGLFASIVTTVKIMGIALTGRAISDGWMMILYGAGFIRRYAPLLLVGGIINPILTIALILLLPRVTSVPAIPTLGNGVTTAALHTHPLLFVAPSVFCVVYTLFHFFLLPRVGAACLGVRYAELFAPLWRPTLVTALSSPVLLAVPRAFVGPGAGRGITLLMLGTTAVAFAAVYAALTAALVLTPAERERFVWSRLRRGAGAPGTGST